jgi:glycosyltransferase involved in cell wall biosynthesis
MLFLAYISILLLAFQLLNSFLNLVYRQKLPSEEPNENIKDVSVLIPARNEEGNIKPLLEDLQKIQHNILEILVYDDHSTDYTRQLVEGFIKQDKRIRLIDTKDLPVGWLGKNHACHQLAKNAVGQLYLFLDADVRISGNIIHDAATYSKQKNLALLTIFPFQILKTLIEKITVPVMNYILLTLLPLIFVRKSPFIAHSAANGQFMLFDAEKYQNFQPHLVFRSSAIEDISIASYFKQKKEKIACLTGDKRIQCRMYKSYQEAMNGFSKNIFMFFGNIPALALLFWAFAAFGFVPILIEIPQFLPGYIAGIFTIQFLYAKSSNQNIFLSTLLFPFQLIFLFITLCNALWVKKKRKYIWKERNIYL